MIKMYIKFNTTKVNKTKFNIYIYTSFKGAGRSMTLGRSKSSYLLFLTDGSPGRNRVVSDKNE